MTSRSAATKEATMEQCRREPSLDELLADSAIHLLMSSDGVSESDILDVLGNARRAQSAEAAEMS
jgi:hypothetical protein